MADIRIPDIAAVDAAAGDTVLGVQGGSVKRLSMQSAAVGFIQSGTGAVARTAQDKGRERVSVLDYMTDAERADAASGSPSLDHTAAFKLAIAAARNIYLPAGTYQTNFGNPVYNPERITNIPDNTHFIGDGESTVWKPHTITALGCIGTDSGSSSVWTEGLRFSNIRFEGSVESNGLLETAHLVYLSSVKRVLFEKCQFIGMRGDGIYLGSGYGAGVNYERHNYDVTVRDCLFDGVTNTNRNGMSVIDVDGLVVDGCHFTRNSDPTMPGSLDFEPDDSYGIIKNVYISGNKFDSATGSGGHITFALSAIPSANWLNIVIVGNNFRNNQGVVIAAQTSSLPTAANGVVIANNTFNATQWPVYKGEGYVYGLTITGNQVFSSFAQGGYIRIGHPSILYQTKGLTISNNVINGNHTHIIDCSDGLIDAIFDHNTINGATTAGIRIGLATTTSNGVSITNNRIGGTPTYTVEHTSTTKNAAKNVYRSNYAAPGVTHTFHAYLCDVAGAVENVFDSTAAPNTFPLGVSVSKVTNKDIVAGAATDDGILRTHRLSSVSETNTYQEFIPAYDATYLDDNYFRKAIDATTWAAWFKVTGV